MTYPTPAGWYPDPTMAGMARYWDGTNWTEQISVAPTPPPSATSAAGLNPAGKVALVGGAAALAGSFLPWVSVITVFGNIEVSGFDAGDGKLTAAAAEAAIARSQRAMMLQFRAGRR